MNTKTLLVLNAIALTSLLVLSTEVLAADFVINFDVPININNYPVSNQSIGAWCELTTAQGRVVNANVKHFPLTGGAYSGSQQVKVSYPVNEAVNIKNYRCALVVEQSTGSGIARSIPTNATILSQINGAF